MERSAATTTHDHEALVREGCEFGCTRARRFLRVPDPQDAEEIILVKCQDCGLVFEDPRPSDAAIDAFYADQRLWTASTDAEGRARSYIHELETKRPVFTNLARRIE